VARRDRRRGHRRARRQSARAECRRAAAGPLVARRRRERSRSRAARRARAPRPRETARDRPREAEMNAQYLARGGVIALAWLTVVNVGATLAIAFVARRGVRMVPGTVRRWRGPASPSIWLALRLLPSAASLLFVAVMVMP